MASPPLVVAYAIAGNLEMDLTKEPIGYDQEGKAVMLDEIWPSEAEVDEAMKVITPDMFRQRYADAMNEPRWNNIPAEPSPLYPWEDASTYIRLPTFFSGLSATPEPITSIDGAKVLLGALAASHLLLLTQIIGADAFGLGDPSCRPMLLAENSSSSKAAATARPSPREKKLKTTPRRVGRASSSTKPRLNHASAGEATANWSTSSSSRSTKGERGPTL